MSQLPNPTRRGFLRQAGQVSLLGAAGILSAPARATASDLAQEKTEESLAVRTIDALEGAYGQHVGLRRNHTKGVGCLGSFKGSPAVARLSRSRLFSGERIDVVARFSIAGGDPEVADNDRSPRGLAIEFRLPDGSLHHMTMLNTPMFFARTPQTFLDKFVALASDPVTGQADPALFKAFVASHSDISRQVEFLNANNPPRSYAEEAYFGIHTFFLVDQKGARSKFKFEFQPRDGIHRLDAEQMADAPRDFLEQALLTRLGLGSVEWDLVLVLGEAGDEELDPTILWPADRTRIKGGVLRLDSAVSSEQAGSFKINFDPMMLSDGVAASKDPILQFRSPSYAVSHGRRLQEL